MIENDGTTKPQLEDLDPWKAKIRAQLTEEQNEWADDQSLYECWEAGWTTDEAMGQIKEAWDNKNAE